MDQAALMDDHSESIVAGTITAGTVGKQQKRVENTVAAMEDPPVLASFSLTHVHYNAADRLSYLCAWLALAPQALCVIYVTLIWSSREAEILLMAAGQFVCEVLNWGLKRWIKEERPPEMHGKGYGMPSSHAQYVTFFSLSLTLFLLFRHDPHPTETHTPFSFLQRLALSVLALVSAAAVAVSRIYLSYHTPRQVLVGCAAGAGFAVVWFGFTTYLRSAGWVDWALEQYLARLFRVRDLVVQEDLADSGWARWEERRLRRQAIRVQGKKSR
ncbi:DOLPP1 protein [Massariosphaeria phaeospora]|uniref:Dolichyldiphosphatase n=1 Tax=Massariosphaeria phaeospora TaxID=100035 RepID=A0A7C8IIM1_9PLEO|nr:DOLPP1 protein [Massariosphaeria phaeospora]